MMMKTMTSTLAPKHLDVKRDRGITIEWQDGGTSFYAVPYLRKMSPSAEQKQLRDELAANPLAILPANAVGKPGEKLTIVGVVPVGRYAIKITFSDGHDTGIYSWEYLREIEPQA